MVGADTMITVQECLETGLKDSVLPISEFYETFIAKDESKKYYILDTASNGCLITSINRRPVESQDKMMQISFTDGSDIIATSDSEVLCMDDSGKYKPVRVTNSDLTESDYRGWSRITNIAPIGYLGYLYSLTCNAADGFCMYNGLTLK